MVNVYKLQNDLTVVTEHIDYVHSVSVGVFVEGGSRSESRNFAGITHMIEHMMFKGTNKRTAKDIAEEVDTVGGNINAYTTKEYTCYYTKMLDTHLDLSIDILSDMLLNSKLDNADIDLERRVVFEEIAMCDDTPEDLVHDMIMEVAWGGQSGLGGSIFGSEQTLNSMNSDVLRGYMQENYTPSNTVIAVAGNFDHTKLRELLEAAFGGWSNTQKANIVYGTEIYRKDTLLACRDTQQVYLCLGFKAFKSEDERSYSAMAFNNVFGSGMSSSLFQKVREEKGLVYSIFSYLNFFVDAGMMVISAGMNAENVAPVLDIVYNEIDIARNTMLDDKTLYKAKEQLKGNYILSLESVNARMQSIGRSQLLYSSVRPPDEIINKIDQISANSIKQCVDEVFNYDNLTIAAIGDIKEGQEFSNK